MPVPKLDTKGDWIRYRAEKYVEIGKGVTQAHQLAEEDWATCFGEKFIAHEYGTTHITKSEEQ